MIDVNKIENEEVRENFTGFWQELITKDGEIDINSLANELSDFHTLMGNVAKVYEHVTGNAISKPMTLPETVCSLADDSYNSIHAEYAEELIDVLNGEGLIKDEDVAKAKEEAKNYCS